jgi:hypothetical protein
MAFENAEMRLLKKMAYAKNWRVPVYIQTAKGYRGTIKHYLLREVTETELAEVQRMRWSEKRNWLNSMIDIERSEVKTPDEFFAKVGRK